MSNINASLDTTNSSSVNPIDSFANYEVDFGDPQMREDNRWDAFAEAGANIDRNNRSQQAFAINELEAETKKFKTAFEATLAEKITEANFDLKAQELGLHRTTNNALGYTTNTHADILQSLNDKIAKIDLSDPNAPRLLNTLTNNITAISAATSQLNSNVTTQTSTGHGSVQTAQSGAVGNSSVTTAQQIEANVGLADIQAEKELGLASAASATQLGISGQQANVALEQITNVGAPVAQGQGDMFRGQGYESLGVGMGTAGFTQGADIDSNTNANADANINYGIGSNHIGYGTPSTVPLSPIGLRGIGYDGMSPSNSFSNLYAGPIISRL